MDVIKRCWKGITDLKNLIINVSYILGSCDYIYLKCTQCVAQLDSFNMEKGNIFILKQTDKQTNPLRVFQGLCGPAPLTSSPTSHSLPSVLWPRWLIQLFEKTQFLPFCGCEGFSIHEWLPQSAPVWALAHCLDEILMALLNSPFKGGSRPHTSQAPMYLWIFVLLKPLQLEFVDHEGRDHAVLFTTLSPAPRRLIYSMNVYGVLRRCQTLG